MAVKASSKYKGGEIMAEQYQVGKVYEMPNMKGSSFPLARFYAICNIQRYSR